LPDEQKARALRGLFFALLSRAAWRGGVPRVVRCDKRDACIAAEFFCKFAPDVNGKSRRIPSD
jgi:hypothetical protein